ncbi:glutamine synthetase family protein [Pararhodobacter zhoushanensis]|uniref:Glutamine synthetase family protein n=1 Tax=Pararhodobacter zhoushanensis TaxID=2479545 RepID=A0ABT3GXZ4_9RHOB|nr:glutamine synthetase family protein [Pararhodobacter zhoushanensis]MCW1932429.1 glutamine synthetase family protein [Pararhodobacter zhoushanensis]
MRDWLRHHSDVKTIRVAAVDLNGQARGKRIPVRFADKLVKEGTRFPFSVMNLDIWGEDIENSPLVFDSGDADGVLKPTGRGFLPMPWLEAPTALLPIWMFHDNGTPYAGDPRHALADVVRKFHARGLYPVCATELEFYLIDDSGREFRVPPSPRSGKRRPGADTLALRALDAFDRFFTDLYDACEAMDIDADTAISEAGPGQFEVNLLHSNDVLKIADDTWLFKMLVRGLARKHGFAASFMAKPYEDWPGNGMHMHFSITDEDGVNQFGDGTHGGSPLLHNAVAGCLKAMAGTTLLLAPHANSYDRLVPEAHAPSGIAWAYENRTAALRIPSGSLKARRIEHRVAGGDINPYLMMAGVLGAALIGIEDELTPPPPITGNAYQLDLPQMPTTWQDALDAFENSPDMKRIFAPLLIDNLVRTKRQEIHYMAELSPEEILDLYIDTV